MGDGDRDAEDRLPEVCLLRHGSFVVSGLERESVLCIGGLSQLERKEDFLSACKTSVRLGPRLEEGSTVGNTGVNFGLNLLDFKISRLQSKHISTYPFISEYFVHQSLMLRLRSSTLESRQGYFRFGHGPEYYDSTSQVRAAKRKCLLRTFSNG